MSDLSKIGPEDAPLENSVEVIPASDASPARIEIVQNNHSRPMNLLFIVDGRQTPHDFNDAIDSLSSLINTLDKNETDGQLRITVILDQGIGGDFQRLGPRNSDLQALLRDLNEAKLADDINIMDKMSRGPELLKAAQELGDFDTIILSTDSLDTPLGKRDLHAGDIRGSEVQHFVIHTRNFVAIIQEGPDSDETAAARDTLNEAAPGRVVDQDNVEVTFQQAEAPEIAHKPVAADAEASTKPSTGWTIFGKVLTGLGVAGGLAAAAAVIYKTFTDPFVPSSAPEFNAAVTGQTLTLHFQKGADTLDAPQLALLSNQVKDIGDANIVFASYVQDGETPNLAIHRLGNIWNSLSDDIKSRVIALDCSDGNKTHKDNMSPTTMTVETNWDVSKIPPGCEEFKLEAS